MDVCPPWCDPARCNVGAAPMNGHGIGEHRSAAQTSGDVSLWLARTASGPVALVLENPTGRIRVPADQAAPVAGLMDRLLEQAYGVR